uniref:BMA-PANL-2 n=1 Tax=Brugia malayi TaxID=6279 RepID=A0A1I9GCR3_BRUMA|nr:BMA-PANL-2 [Brugia malayi]
MRMYGSSPGHSENVLISADGLTSMNNEARIPEGGFALLSTTSQNAALAHFITALTFDPYQELLWTGNNTGRVVSFYGAQLDKYTAFLSSTNSNIRALLASETVIFSLTSKRLRANRRQGISLFTHMSDHMTDLTCMHRLSDVPHKLLLGGNQQQIIQFDVETQKEIRIVSVKQKNCLALRSNQKFLFSSDSEGNVTLRHLTTVDAIHALQAHQGSIADFDVCGNKLITCGYSPRMGKMAGDRFIMIYDLRTLRSLPPVPLPMAPSYCRFLPSYSDGRIMVCSQSGELIVMDLNEQSSQMPIQLDTNGFAITSLDVSTSKQCIAFGDQTGLIHLFSDRMEPIFNENSWGTDFPDPIAFHPPVNIDDPEPSYGVFPLPFPVDDHYASDWPEQLCIRRFRQPDPISEKVIDSMRMVQFVGYAHNPRAGTSLRGFNVCPYTSSTHDKCSNAMKNDDILHIPKFYLRTEGKLTSKAEEIDFKRYNRTEFNALENSVETSPACMLLLAMYHLMNVRTVFLSHFCYLESCISCEMNLLFRLLTDRPVSSVVSAKNFMKTFRSIDDGKKWADAVANASLAQTVRLFMQVFSKILDKELSETTAGVALRKEMEISFTLNNHCIRCSEHYQSALAQLYISLAYPTSNEKIGFCTLLEKTLNCPEQNEAICQKCGKLARFASTRRVRLLPNILALDMTASTETEQAFWISHIQAFESRSVTAPNSVTEHKVKLCRYGTECRNPNCRYLHNDDSKCETNVLTTEGTTTYYECPHYIPNSVHIKITDGICTVSENKMENSTSFHLVAAIFIINEDEETQTEEHLVTAIRSKQDSCWILFNSWSVTRISENEALRLHACWKLPAILYYVQDRENGGKEAAKNESRAIIPRSVFWNDLDSNKIKIPERGSKVAIYAKYAISEAGEKRVSEVSAVDEDGSCFISSVIKEPGIKSDMDNSQTLKRVSLKLLYLIQEKITIIGYKIEHLFEMLNIHVSEEQVKDIVLLYRPLFKRSLSLNALAQHFFGESVDEEETDPIDLARLSLRLYTKFNELKEADEADINIAVLTHALETNIS